MAEVVERVLEVAMGEYKIGFSTGYFNDRCGGDKYDVTLGRILHHEGGCQNGRADTGFTLGLIRETELILQATG